jgi:hypothetical protein
MINHPTKTENYQTTDLRGAELAVKQFTTTDKGEK